MRRALLSVSDKTGITDFANGLVAAGWQILSTGGTARALRDAHIAVTDVSDVTGHPEMMHGRVKTLHPAIHAGILARREVPEDLAAMRAQGYAPIDLVAVNLYPFHEAVAARAALPDAMEQVDIGGPTMLRSAAKNHAHVLVVVDPADYARVLQAVDAGRADERLRRELAAKVFAHTARYDAAIAAYFTANADGASHAGAGHTDQPVPIRKASDLTPEENAFPDALTLHLRRVQALRYGENPDQSAAFYADTEGGASGLASLRQLHGKELSFNNLLDVESAVTAASAWHDDARAAAVVIKHTTPCGVALAADARTAYERALAADPVSAFGGIVAFNRTVEGEVATSLAGTFLEIVVAPGFSQEALEILTRKKNLRLIELPIAPAGGSELDYKRVRGGFLLQTRMRYQFPEDDWQVVTRRAPESGEREDLRFAWRVCASVKSNAIVLAHDARTVGIGAGQMSRVDSSRIAVLKAQDQHVDLTGATLASDAFFPFRDGVDAAAAAGVRAIIQPGGSVRDEEVIGAADEHGIAMIFTGRRVFRH
jgi:phosphoribosylaminoimidazolecarboxamide formyltransferase/IMP cyclohydrolase